MPQWEVSPNKEVKRVVGNRKMRNLVLTLACGAALFASGCGTPSATNNTNSSNAAATSNRPFSTSNTALPPVSSAHGDNSVAPPPATTAAPNNSAKPGMDTAALDKKIERAEAKAKAAGATQADKLAAAAAYVERGNVYYSAGSPQLYKFALGDFRRALRYQPDNQEAIAKRDQIVDIYENSLKRAVPTNGLEP
jgi:hypothetical protein